MARSVWKGPFVNPALLQKVLKKWSTNNKEPIKTWARGSTILPQFVGLNFLVHNGKKFVPVLVVEDMVGHKLGEFVPTRIFTGHSGDKKAKVRK